MLRVLDDRSGPMTQVTVYETLDFCMTGLDEGAGVHACNHTVEKQLEILICVPDLLSSGVAWAHNLLNQE